MSFTTEQQQSNEEIKMRVIFFEELLHDEAFSELTKTETDRLLKIVTFFAKENTEEIQLSVLKGNFDISEEFIKKTSFCLQYGKTVKVKKYFKWFSGNKDYINKSRNKPKEEISSVAVVEEQQPRENIDYDRIKNNFNDTFKGTNVPSIRILSDDRKKGIKNLYNKMSKHLQEKCDIYEFYEAYFDLLRTEGDKKCNFVKGWHNSTSNSWFQPTLDFYLKQKTFVKINENQ